MLIFKKKPPGRVTNKNDKQFIFRKKPPGRVTNKKEKPFFDQICLRRDIEKIGPGLKIRVG